MFRLAFFLLGAVAAMFIIIFGGALMVVGARAVERLGIHDWPGFLLITTPVLYGIKHWLDL